MPYGGARSQCTLVFRFLCVCVIVVLYQCLCVKLRVCLCLVFNTFPQNLHLLWILKLVECRAQWEKVTNTTDVEKKSPPFDENLTALSKVYRYTALIVIFPTSENSICVSPRVYWTFLN